MYLLNTVNTYRVATEQEALNLRDELNNLPYGELVAFSYTIKQTKSKNEPIEIYYVVKAKLMFNAEKECESMVKVEYNL